MIILPLTLKDCAHASQLHLAAFYRGWTEKDFQNFLNDPLVFGLKIQLREPSVSHTALFSPSQKRSRNKFGMTTEDEINFCGYILWREVEDEAEILILVIAPPFQGSGMGTLLLNALSKRLSKKNISKLFLEVAEDNNAAQSFYLKNGFSILGKRKNYYERPNNKFVDGLNLFKTMGVNPRG